MKNNVVCRADGKNGHLIMRHELYYQFTFTEAYEHVNYLITDIKSGCDFKRRVELFTNFSSTYSILCTVCRVL